MNERIRDNVKEVGGLLWPAEKGDISKVHMGEYKSLVETDAGTPEKLASILDPSSRRIVIHAGACCGEFATKYADIFRLVIAVEPIPENFYCLCHNADQRNVIKIQACLGSEKGMCNIGKFLPGVGSWHLLPGTMPQGIFPVITIDSIPIHCCDLIHLDLEGYEYEALLGARETIMKFRPVIALEVEENWMRRYNRTIEDLDKLLQGEYGYIHSEKAFNDHIFLPKEACGIKQA